MKIRLEDYSLEDGACGVVPFEIRVYADKDPEILVIPEFFDVAKEFSEKYAEKPLSEEGLSFLEKAVYAQMKNAGYDADNCYYGRIVCYMAGKDTKLKVVTLPETDGIRIIKIETTAELEKYELPYGMYGELDDGDPLDVYFAAVKDGKIVAYAGVNDYSEDRYFEIHVETEEDYRRKGLGKAVTGALICHIRSEGERVMYACEKDNTASVKLAESLGLDVERESVSLVYYALEDGVCEE